MRGVITGLLGASVVMYAANHASIAADKGNNWTCVVVGVMSLSAGLTLWGVEISRKFRR